MQADGAEEDGPQDVDVLRVEVIPDLAIAVDGTATVDVDIGAAELEEGGDVLEDLGKGVRLPVRGVIGELDVALNVCGLRQLSPAIFRGTNCPLTNVNVVQERKVQRSANHIVRALREDDMSAVVALVDGLEDVRRVIRDQVVMALDVAVPVPGRRRWERLVRLLGREGDRRPGALVLGRVLREVFQVELVRIPGGRCNGSHSLQQQDCYRRLEQHLGASDVRLRALAGAWEQHDISGEQSISCTRRSGTANFPALPRGVNLCPCFSALANGDFDGVRRWRTWSRPEWESRLHKHFSRSWLVENFGATATTAGTDT